MIRRGLVTRHQLRGSSWVRLRHDVYADARLDRDHELACHAAMLRLPPGAMIAGPSAAYLHGIEHAAGFDDDVHVLVPRVGRVDSQRGLRVHLAGADTPATPTNGVVADAQPSTSITAQLGAPTKPSLRRTDPSAAAWEAAAWLDPLRAVAIVDSLLASGLTTRAALTAVRTANADRPGGRRACWIFDLADPGAQSPPESQLRVRLVLGGIPRPVAQHPIQLAGGLVLHPDLAWPEFRVAVEYDGRWHADPEQLHRDRRRLNLLVGAGWLVLHVTSRRLQNDFPAVLSEVRSALISRGWRR
ncbi:DUF559 domain-containing protein [Micromonospora parathelypteridis]|uniref:DUF559 domain-containing protein n=1 Tax=Micromonospora parathelypteridis TaxID=1839617 RepID=A0A840VPM9_9ACTN|nr:DUF559 domain-containing protein [Micromonospora parathelypteridis]MBB5477926.1 hypothetical protein [Micromonospora parathelypteridis]